MPLPIQPKGNSKDANNAPKPPINSDGGKSSDFKATGATRSEERMSSVANESSINGGGRSRVPDKNETAINFDKRSGAPEIRESSASNNKGRGGKGGSVSNSPNNTNRNRNTLKKKPVEEELPDGWEIDAETGVKHKILPKTEWDPNNPGWSVSHFDEDADASFDLNGLASQFLGHLQVAPSAEEKRRLFEEKKRQLRMQNKIYEETNKEVEEE